MLNPYPPSKHLFGMNIVVSADHPRQTLAEDVPVSPEFRIEMNQWMLGFFGTYNNLPDGECLVSQQQNVLYMNPRTLVKFKQAMDAKQANINRGTWKY